MRTARRALMPLLAVLVAQTLWAQVVQVRGKLNRSVVLAAGARQEGTIELDNTGADPCQVRLYQADYLRQADGTTDYPEPEKAANPRSNAAWVTVAPKLLLLAAHEKTEVRYVIQVPADDKLTGSYWSVIMVEPVVAEVEKPEGEADKVKVAIRTVVRYAVLVNVNIGDTGVRALKFLDKRVVSEANKRFLQLDVLNSGERQLTPVIWAEFYRPDGTLAARVEDRQRNILPGCGIRSSLDITALPAGQYEAMIVVDNGDDNVFGARYTLAL